MTDIAKTIVRAAMKGATEDHINQVEDTAWATIEALKDRTARLEAIRFAFDCGVLSIEYKFQTTSDQALASLLWNEFGDEIDPATIPTSNKAAGYSAWRREIVDTPRAKKPDELQWHDKRLKKANLPMKVSRIQIGEIFGGEIEWGELYRDVDLEWGHGPNGEVGLVTDMGDCFQGWDAERRVYLRYDDDFSCNEHVARIAL
jgi:hypothetical protein